MSGPDLARTVRSFDEAAADFDALTPHLWGPISAAAVARARPRPGERILDACCGSGASALPTADSVGPAGHVDAVDLSAALVDRLRRHATGRPQLHPAVDDVTGWSKHGYDLVQCVLGVFFLPRMTEDSAGLAALARPGGRVAFTIWRSGAVAEAGQHCADAVQRVLGVHWPQRARHPVEDINQPLEFARWIAGLGLEDVEVDVNPHAVDMTPYVAWLVVRGSGFRSMTEGLTADQLGQVHKRYLDAVTGSVLDATTLTGTARRAVC